MPLLSLSDLHIRFGSTTVVDGVNLSIEPGETLALVGESGCGKSVTALSILRLLPPPGLASTGIHFDGRDLSTLTEKQLDEVRGGDVGVIWQDPLAALNPLLPVGVPIIEVLMRHRQLSKKEARAQANEVLRRVGIPQPEKRLDDYPHQLSGGQRQRVMIAAAIACNPKLLIADEPTTALDVSVQAQILELLKALAAEMNMAMLLITHDLGVVAQVAQRIAVMYAGQIVEQGRVAEIFARPQHPYTQGLLLATPRLDGDAMPLPIPGTVPPPGRWPQGCRFAARCPLAKEKCQEMPPLEVATGAPAARCWFAGVQAWQSTP